MYPRTVRIRSTNGTVNEYVRIVEAYREDGKVKQRVVADLGRKDLLVDILPKLRRLLTGDTDLESGKLVAPQVGDASDWGPVLVVRDLFDQLGLWSILDRHLGRPPIQADISLHRAEADGHLAALIAVARRRALEPVMLEDVEVEVMATEPLPHPR